MNTQTHAITIPPAPWLRFTLGELTVVNVGFYAAMSLLTLHLFETLKLSAGEASAVLLASSLGLRVSRFFLTPLMDRLPVRRSLVLFTAIGAVGYAGLFSFSAFWPVLFCVFAVGMGYGCNGLLVTTLSSFAPQGGKRNVYALQYMLANIAAAVGPAFVHWFILPANPFAPFLFAGVMFAAGSFIAARVDGEHLPNLESPHGFYKTAKLLLHRGEIWKLFLSVMMGWLLYAQKFAVLPLFITGSLHKPEMVGTAMLLFSGVIIFTTIPLSAQLAKRGMTPQALASSGFVLYAAGYTLMFIWPVEVLLYLCILIWAVAEGLLMPALNNTTSKLTATHERLAGFSLGAIAIAAGEFLGMAGGAQLYKMCAAQGNAATVFLYLGSIGGLCLLVHVFFHRKAVV